ncbi:MAG: DUF6797 domain-containing protein [Verrucomicrobiales bacterium]
MKKQIFATLALSLASLAAAEYPTKLKEKPPSFFEPGFPFYHTKVDFYEQYGDPHQKARNSLKDNFVVRGIILPLSSGQVLAFDQDLLRVAGVWTPEEGKPPVTVMTMAQISYDIPGHKSGLRHPLPTGPFFFPSELKPGVASSPEALKEDPREKNKTEMGDFGRGPLPVEHGRFESLEDCGSVAVLNYRVGETQVKEWHEARTISGQQVVLRHFAVAPHKEALHFSFGPAEWTLTNPYQASGQLPDANGKQEVATNTKEFRLDLNDGDLVATLAPSSKVQMVSMALVPSATGDKTLPGEIGETPAIPTPDETRRWPEKIVTEVISESVNTNGLTLDLVHLPTESPWKRRVRPADIDFLSPDVAAVLTYDGDVWLASGLADEKLGQVTWQRYASGLHESLSLAVVEGVVQVATKNGIVRLHDSDGNGEADRYENFCDLMRQSQSNRAFPLDMGIGPDGSTYVSQGGIPTGGSGTSFLGSVSKISPDGREIEIVSTGGREPYVTVHPQSGMLTGTDQQGQYVPSSVVYLIRPGDDFGFGKGNDADITPPLVWIPHTEDNSSSSQVWLTGKEFGALDGSLLHLSYGNGGLFLVTPDMEVPTPQGAVIPLEFDTQMPLLQAQVQAEQGAVWLAGFKIYDSRAPYLDTLGRLRLSGEALTKPISAQSCADGVILRFASPLKAESVKAQNVTSYAWNYKRSAHYGSGRYKMDGSEGMNPVGVSQAVLSADRKAVFVHLPELPESLMQLEVRHAFQLESGAAAEGASYYTIHQPHKLDLAEEGFSGVDLGQTEIVSLPITEGTPSAEIGKTLSETMGCIACHSVDGSKVGKTGPSWKGIWGIDREFERGSVESVNEFYIKDSILNPNKKIVKGYQQGMASYKGVLSDAQIESIILYIKSLK